MSLSLRQSIQKVQKTGIKHGFTIIVVGGAIVRLIGAKTAIKKIDEENQILIVSHAENPGIERIDDPKTTIDIDCIAFSTKEDPFTKTVKDAFYALKHDIKQLSREYENFPAVSIEPVLYHPHFPKPKSLTQFVSSIESYHDHDFFFRLGNAKEDVQATSLSPWTIAFTDSNEQITTFMPPAIQKRYTIRGFGIKPKDTEKVFGNNASFSQFVANFRIKTKGKYDKVFTEWDTFAEKIHTAKQPSMRIKKTLWNLYWQTIGTYLAHGTGLVGKVLLPLGNTFFTGK